MTLRKRRMRTYLAMILKMIFPEHKKLFLLRIVMTTLTTNKSGSRVLEESKMLVRISMRILKMLSSIKMTPCLKTRTALEEILSPVWMSVQESLEQRCLGFVLRLVVEDVLELKMKQAGAVLGSTSQPKPSF